MLPQRSLRTPNQGVLSSVSSVFIDRTSFSSRTFFMGTFYGTEDLSVSDVSESELISFPADLVQADRHWPGGISTLGCCRVVILAWTGMPVCIASQSQEPRRLCTSRDRALLPRHDFDTFESPRSRIRPTGPLCPFGSRT